MGRAALVVQFANCQGERRESKGRRARQGREEKMWAEVLHATWQYVYISNIAHYA